MRAADKFEYVAVIGGANVDILGIPAESLRERDSNPGTVHISTGGVARNVAEDLVRLGVRCSLVTAVGNDQYGEMILALGNAAGIDMQCVRQVDNAPTSTYLAALDETGDMRVAISDMDIMEQLNAEWLQQHRNVVDRSCLIVIDANLTDHALGWLAGECSTHTVFADTVSSSKAARLKPYLGAVHTLKTSPIEAEALTGLDAGTEAQLGQLADSIHAAGVERLFVTRGVEGVFYSTADERGSVAPDRRGRRVCSTSGAGDAFLSGLVYAWLEDWPLQRSVQFASAAAQLTVSDHAASSPALSLAAIDRILHD